MLCYLFVFEDTSATEIYTLSLHDALPIWLRSSGCSSMSGGGCERSRNGSRAAAPAPPARPHGNPLSRTSVRPRDRKSTRLNSSHGYISYAVFCLKKKKP